MTVLRRKKPEDITRLARGIVTDRILIVDPDDGNWISSLFVLASLGAFDNIRNLGAILVPVGVHVGGYWTGNVPAMTLEVELVAKGDIDPINREVRRMRAALHPESGTVEN